MFAPKHFPPEQLEAAGKEALASVDEVEMEVKERADVDRLPDDARQLQQALTEKDNAYAEL